MKTLTGSWARGACIAISVALSGCSTIPQIATEYCQVTATHYPLRPSRKDTAETKRQLLQANTIRERICNAPAS